MRGFLRRLYERCSYLLSRFCHEPETCRVCRVERPDAPTTRYFADLHADVVARGGPLCSECFCRAYAAKVVPYLEAIRAEHDPACLN